MSTVQLYSFVYPLYLLLFLVLAKKAGIGLTVRFANLAGEIQEVRVKQHKRLLLVLQVAREPLIDIDCVFQWKSLNIKPLWEGLRIVAKFVQLYIEIKRLPSRVVTFCRSLGDTETKQSQLPPSGECKQKAEPPAQATRP